MEQFCSVSNGISHFSVTGRMKKGQKKRTVTDSSRLENILVKKEEV